MWAESGSILLGVACLLLGTDSLVNGISGMLARQQSRGYLVALIAAACAALFPIIAVSVAALVLSQRELALGGIVGGAIAQLGLMLGLAALIAPLLARLKVLNRIYPILLGAVVLVWALGFDQAYSKVDGWTLLAGGIVAVVLIGRSALNERKDAVAALFDQPLRVFGLPLLTMRLLIGLALLAVGAWRLIVGCSGLSALLAMDALIVGLLVCGPASVLAGLPTAVQAARRGHGEIALGQALFAAGASLLLVLGAVVAWQPLAVSLLLTRIGLPALFAISLAVYPMMRSDGELSRREGFVLLVFYALIVVIELLLTSS